MAGLAVLCGRAELTEVLESIIVPWCREGQAASVRDWGDAGLQVIP